MTTLRITLSPTRIDVAVDDLSAVIPVGVATLADGIDRERPRPEELTNAIGLVLDHLEDVAREVPPAMFAERVEVAGEGAAVLADVEVGGTATLPFELSRDAAEDVFRTLATESQAERRHNPGLPDTHLHSVLGTAAAVVAVMRRLQTDAVWLHGDRT